jgi:hypothetical protein
LEKDENAVTAQLEALAPSLAKMPRWTRNMSDSQVKWLGRAAKLGVALLFAAASGLFWRTIDLGTEYKLVHKDVEFLERQAKDVKQLVADMQDVKHDTHELKKWHDGLVCEAERDWARRHGKHPLPCVPEPEVAP